MSASKELQKRIHDTLVKVMHMEDKYGGARIGAGGAIAGGRKKKKRGGAPVGGVGVGGRKRKMKAGVLVDDLMHPNYYGQSKRKGGAPRAKRGGAKNPWIAHVKAYARKHGLSYGEAMKKARSSY